MNESEIVGTSLILLNANSVIGLMSIYTAGTIVKINHCWIESIGVRLALIEYFCPLIARVAQSAVDEELLRTSVKENGTLLLV